MTNKIMFRRLVLENSAAFFTIAAFVIAAAIYLAFAWRALRMKRPQLAHFENLPFGDSEVGRVVPNPPLARSSAFRGALGTTRPTSQS
jgi:hypothetical protein